MRQVRQHCMVFVVAAAVSVAVTAPAAAQSVARPGTWTVTPFLGSSLDVSEGADNNLALGFAVGWDLTPNVGFEGELSYLFDLAGDSNTVDWSLTNVSGNFIYHFDTRTMTPYATFGLGFERSSLDFESPDPLELLRPSTTEIAFNFGGGVKYPLTDSLLVRGDLRRFQSNDLAPDFWRLYAGLTFNLG